MNKKLGKKILSLFLVITFVFSAFGIIRATAETKAFTLTDASVKEKSDSVESNVSVKNGNVNDDLVFHKVNDSITYKLTFKNNDSKDYIIKGITDDNSSEYVSYTYDQYKDETIKAGETKDILVKITYSKEVTDANKRELSNPVKLSFEIEDTEGNTVTANVVVNPKTNDGIMMYVALASISLIGISVLLLKNKKSGKLLVMVALLAPLAVKAAEASFIISFGGEIKLHDKVLVTTEVNGEKVSKLIPYQDKFAKPADPHKDGEDFLGWFIGDEPYNFDKAVADDVVITAKFKLPEYTVTFDPNGGKVLTESVKVTKGQTVADVIPFPPYYSKFLGWFDGKDDSANLIIAKNGEFTPTSNITLYAHWEFGDKDPNLVDVDNNQSISLGDIVNFGPEEFYVVGFIGYNSDYVRLMAKDLIGDVNGIKQATTNLVKSKYANSVYWAEPSTPSSNPVGIINTDYTSYQGEYSTNIGNVNNYSDYYGSTPDRTKQNNLVYSVLSQYEDYLNEMFDFYSDLDASLLTYNEANALNCKYSTEGSCNTSGFLNIGYNYWIGSIVFDPDVQDSAAQPKNGYLNKDTSSIENTDISDELYVRPVITVSTSDIVVPWN